MYTATAIIDDRRYNFKGSTRNIAAKRAEEMAKVYTGEPVAIQIKTPAGKITEYSVSA